MTNHLRVKTLDQLNALTDDELRAEKLRYKQRLSEVEDAIDSAQAEGRDMRSMSSARRHYRTGLGLIKEITVARHHSYEADKRRVGELYRAVGVILEDDSDANWDRLQAAYEAMPTPTKDRISA